MFIAPFLLFTLAIITADVSARPTTVRRSICPKRDVTTTASSEAVVVPTSSATTAAHSSTRLSSAPSKPSSSALSSVKNTATSSSPSTPTGTIGGLLGNLFPVPGYSKSWTTCTESNSALALADSTFRPTNVLKGTVHSYVDAPDGKHAMKAHYPKGSYTFGFQPQGGFSFYAPGPDSLDLTTAKEATFGYSVYFPAGFEFNLGGKLPGLYGGNSASEAIGCSGGSRSAACFSVRLMWRTNGAGEFYTYLPPYTDPRFAANKGVCNVAPKSECNPTYGASVGRGSFTFATGGWTTISERVKLNDVGQANGEIQLFANGESVINVSGLILRDSDAGRIRGMQMQTFFGGSKPEYASPKDQDVYFSDFSMAIIQTL